ncbi:hypothetical protein EP232_00600 [bacterium]|nr:MAG: hypothetical protein EP232_00600 [bacterium]
MSTGENREDITTEEKVLEKLGNIENGIENLVDQVKDLNNTIQNAVEKNRSVQRRRVIEASLFYIFILVFLGFVAISGMKLADFFLK